MINKTLTVTLTSIAALAGLSGLANAQNIQIQHLQLHNNQIIIIVKWSKKQI